MPKLGAKERSALRARAELLLNAASSFPRFGSSVMPPYLAIQGFLAMSFPDITPAAADKKGGGEDSNKERLGLVHEGLAEVKHELEAAYQRPLPEGARDLSGPLGLEQLASVTNLLERGAPLDLDSMKKLEPRVRDLSQTATMVVARAASGERAKELNVRMSDVCVRFGIPRLTDQTMGTLVQSEVEAARGYTPAHEARFQAAGEHMQAGIRTLLALRGAAVAGIESESKVKDPPKRHFPWADLAIAALTAATGGVAGAVFEGLAFGKEAAKVVQKGGRLVAEAEEHLGHKLSTAVVEDVVKTAMDKSLDMTVETIKEENDEGGGKSPVENGGAGGGGASVDFGTRFFEAQKIALIKASAFEESAAIDMVESNRPALAEDPEGAIRTVEVYAERLKNPPDTAIEHQRAHTRAKYVAALARAAVTTQNEEEDKEHEDAEVRAAMIEKSGETGNVLEARMAVFGVDDPAIRKVVHAKHEEARIAKEKEESEHGGLEVRGRNAADIWFLHRSPSQGAP